MIDKMVFDPSHHRVVGKVKIQIISQKKILTHNTLYILPYHWFARLFIFAIFLAQAAAASLKAFN